MRRSSVEIVVTRKVGHFWKADPGHFSKAPKQAAHDQALRHLCDELNATETTFPGTDLRLIYKIGPC
ncbi:MAG: hypothetical protein ACYCPD_17075 [Acidobacteriaceae bacterium]